MLRKRGAAEAGAIFIKIDHLDGTASLLQPASSFADLPKGVDRQFARILSHVEASDVEARMIREIKFDTDLWFVEIENRSCDAFVEEIDI
jgi:hypothetical protein